MMMIVVLLLLIIMIMIKMVNEIMLNYANAETVMLLPLHKNARALSCLLLRSKGPLVELFRC